MPTKPGAYYRPESIEEALQLLGKPDSVALAGGTKLLASESGLAVNHVVDLQALGLSQIAGEEKLISVGSTCTLAELDAFFAQHYAAHPAALLLREAIKHEGPNTYRNAATLGGTVASRLADSELLAALLVMDARISFAAVTFAEDVELADFLSAENPTAGLIVSITIPWQEGQGAVERVARTPADYPIVSVTTWQPAGGEIRLAATGVSARPSRLANAEASAAAGLSDETISIAASAARDTAVHPGDFRGDANYRAEMVKVLTRRVLEELAK
jgi:CO/xanthine dehydrogenase FAD-binding subunit